MTLIQTVFTNDFILQVSDRRLTKGFDRNKSIIIDDENATKLVSWNSTFTVGFTGLARIDRRQTEPTSLWIAKTICDYPLFEWGMAALRDEAEKRIRPLPKPWDRRLAVVVGGFDARRGPVVGLVTNFDTETGKPFSNLSEFRTDLLLPPRGKWSGSHVAGARMSDLHRNILKRQVPRFLRQRHPEGINQAVRLMVYLQRLVAKKDPTVGADALCVFIPRVQQGLPGGPTMMSNLGGPEIPTGISSFGFFDSRGWQFEQRGPLAAEGGFVKEIWATADPEFPDNQTIGVRFHKVPPSWKS